jgi:hypothetical protein
LAVEKTHVSNKSILGFHQNVKYSSIVKDLQQAEDIMITFMKALSNLKKF